MERIGTILPPRNTYGRLIAEMITHPGEWFLVSPDEVKNSPVPYQRVYFTKAAKRHGVKIETTLRDDAFYVRVVGE